MPARLQSVTEVEESAVYRLPTGEWVQAWATHWPRGPDPGRRGWLLENPAVLYGLTAAGVIVVLRRGGQPAPAGTCWPTDFLVQDLRLVEAG